MAAEVMLMNEIVATAAQMGIDMNIDFSSIQLPPGENCGIISDDEDVYHDDQLELDSGFGNIIVVDNLPVIGVIKEDGLWMPVDSETKKTLGYCFIEYNTPQEAELAKEKTHGYKLDRAHIFVVNMFDDFDKYMKVPDEWAPPEIKPYTPGENLQKWLADGKARDQFVIRAGTDTEVLWNDARQSKTELVYKRTYWTESFVQWSPMGTYLATVHRQGAAVWGGANTFNRLMRYAHPQVKLIDFSPGEKFLVTYSSHEPSNPRDANVRWGGGKEDKYFAKLGKNMISIYETETFSLIDKKSLKVENVVDFSWSPTDPIIALFVPELGGGNQPARVSLVQIPGKEELRQKNLFSISDCKMYWQSNGEYLAVKADRYTKTKKSTYSGFELFRIKERDIPIEVLELDNKNEKIIAFAWEPKGHRFAVIHGDNPRPDISFYTMRSTHNLGRVSKLTTLKGKQANSLFWSPGGRFIVLAGLKGFNGQLEFFNVDELETMATAEHFMATMLNGIPLEGMLPLQPPSFLTPEKEEEISKNLKKYSKKYEAEDQDVSMLLSEQDREKRRILKEEWEKWVSEWRQAHEEEQIERQKLRDGEASEEEEEEYEAKEVEVEEVLDVSEEVISFEE
ncbi:Eukaryotic translation initiation factor 3 subunit B [Hibiscus syriacus]|uniref:Eukaryotic translation initiation factor 3 subunit B n=1 Tax=Hibiscus syriacus TaxID=106335 RepID=A0A6A3BK15_HIBSY|nr:Eukaryotic translation initiation factor 3 subunit B [Hibiscus syriacus]